MGEEEGQGRPGADARPSLPTGTAVTEWSRRGHGHDSRLTPSAWPTYRVDTSNRYILESVDHANPRGDALVLELAVLGLLKESPMSGYELKKQLVVKLGAFWRVSFGSLYPCLKRLAADGALEVEENRFTSRKKHVYRLTERGEQLFLELLESADVHDLEQDRFSMRLAFFRYLRPETRLDQLERRRGYLQERLSHLRASLRAVRDRLDAYTLELMDHGLDEHEREIAWLDRLIAAERGSASGDSRTAARSRSTTLQVDPVREGSGLAAQNATVPRDPRLPTQAGQAAPTP